MKTIKLETSDTYDSKTGRWGGSMTLVVQCTLCRGEGKSEETGKPCPDCGGLSRVLTENGRALKEFMEFVK